MLYDLYQIIPKIDSTSFMCVSKDGLSHFSITKDRKCEPLTDGYKLIFDNEEEAQNYINYALDPREFYVQGFAGNEEILAMVVHP